jgi:glycosyltransferase involved in cell wall biosynthesis
VIIEAHACAVPVIGSGSGAIPEVIGGGGLIFAERHPEALGAAVRKLWADPAHARELGLKGRQQVLSRYTWRRVAKRMHEIYAETLDDRSS